MADTLAPRAVIGVMTPAMYTVVQPELELLRPEGVTNQIQRFRLGGDSISDDLPDEAAKLMDCNPTVIAVGLTTDAGPGGPDKLASRCADIAEMGASQADYAGLRALGATRVGIVTPFNAEVDAVVQANTEAAGFDVVAIQGTCAPSLPAICETPMADIRDVFASVAALDCDVILQVGTALPFVALIAELEAAHGKPIVACNAAVYWQALRQIGLTDPVNGFGKLLETC